MFDSPENTNFTSYINAFHASWKFTPYILVTCDNFFVWSSLYPS